MNLGETIQSLRKEKGFSQEVLAEKIGVSRQAVSKWESGASIPEIEKLIELSKLFGVSLHHLLQVAEPKAQVGQRETGTQTEPFPQTDFGQQQKRLEGRQVEEGEAVDFSEAQLASVQEITAQHIAKEGERQRRRWKKTCWLGILLLICTVWALRGQNKDLVKRLDNLENELYRTRLLIDEQTAQIEQTIRIGLEAQTSLVASYQYEI